MSAIAGMKIRTEARWVADKGSSPINRSGRIYQLLIMCCAADAEVIPVILEFGQTLADFPPNTWLKVSGTYPTQDGAIQPVLVVDHVLATTAPDEYSPRKRWPLSGR